MNTAFDYAGKENKTEPLTSAQFQKKWNVSSSVKKLIVDTDLNYFADDAYALYALLQADRLGYIDLCGVTACCGNTIVAGVTHDILAFLAQVGRSEVPVYIGTDEPLNGYVDIEAAQKETGPMIYVGAYSHLDNYTDDYTKALECKAASWTKAVPKSTPMEKSAEDFIIEQVHRYPGEVTIVALGGLINVAKALEKDPSLAEDAAGIIYMGGAFDTWGENLKTVEFNFWYDPKASNISLGAKWQSQAIVSHDAATTCKKGFDIYERALKQNHNPFSQIIAEYYEEGCNTTDEVKKKIENDVLYCWDAIVAAYILKPEICTSIEKRYLRVDERMGPTFGSTLNWKEGMQIANSYPADVVLAVDRERFWEFLFDLFEVQ